MLKRCEQCGIEFKTKHYHGGQRFCSNRCSGLWTAKERGQSGTVRQQCPTCGREFSAFAGDKRKHCSAECYHVAKRTDRPKCEVCGKPVRLMRNRYCSKHCSVAARPRPGTGSWMGFYQRAWKANPDTMPCVLCSEPGKHRHHPDYGKPEFVLWLCTGCHRKLHADQRRKTGRNAMPTEAPICE